MNSKIDIVIEYLVKQGQLTAASGNPLDYVTFTHTDGNYSISTWSFPETQLSDSSLLTVYNSAPFQTYLADRPKIIERTEARKQFDTVIRRFANVVLDEINILRQREGLPLRTIAQLKNAMDTKD